MSQWDGPRTAGIQKGRVFAGEAMVADLHRAHADFSTQSPLSRNSKIEDSRIKARKFERRQPPPCGRRGRVPRPGPGGGADAAATSPAARLPHGTVTHHDGGRFKTAPTLGFGSEKERPVEAVQADEQTPNRSRTVGVPRHGRAGSCQAAPPYPVQTSDVCHNSP